MTQQRVILILFLLLTGLSLAGCGDHSDTVWVSGQVEATTSRVGSRIGGRVAEKCVEEGDRIQKAGAVLIRLEDMELRAMVEAAEAKKAQADAGLALLEAGTRYEKIDQARAAVSQAEAAYDLALAGAREQEVEAARSRMLAVRAERDEAWLDLLRAVELAKDGVIPDQQRDQAEATYDRLESQYQAALEELDRLLAGSRDQEIAMRRAQLEEANAALEALRNGPRPQEIAAARARRDAARAEVARLREQLDEMTVRAPLPGVVESIEVEVGDLVDAGPIVRIVDPESLEIFVYVSADVLGLLEIGQEVDMRTDSHGDQLFTGRIAFISPQGEFTPRNLQTEEERVKQVFAVKVKTDSHEGRLRAGMTALVAMPRPPLSR